MGAVANIKFDCFPKQGNMLYKRATVYFHYNVENRIFGTIVRNDIEEPFVTLIKLDDGRYVIATECMYSVP